MCDQESTFSDLWGITEGGKCDGMETDKYCIYSARRRQWIWKLKIVKINVDSWQNSRNDYYIWSLAMLSKENVSAFDGSLHEFSMNTFQKREYHVSFVNKDREMLEILLFAFNSH